MSYSISLAFAGIEGIKELSSLVKNGFTNAVNCISKNGLLNALLKLPGNIWEATK